MDLFHKLLNAVDHNRYLCLGAAVAIALAIGLVACAPATSSVLDPSKTVSREQLNTEAIEIHAGLQKGAAELATAQAKLQELIAKHNADVTAANAKLEAAKADIEKQEAVRVKIVEIIGGLAATAASGGGLSAPAAVSTAIQLLVTLGGVGAMADNRRKDKTIETIKSQASATDKDSAESTRTGA